MTQKCNSCFKGFDGRNGNGYQPCSCLKNLNLFLCLDQSKLIHAQKTELASGESGLNENCLCPSE